MPIRRILADGAFDQAAIDLMTEAYEVVCKELSLTDSPYEAANDAVADAVVGFVREGERNLARIVQRVVQGVQGPAAQ